MTQPTDIIICLGNGSQSGNDELRIMLRSLERNISDFGRIFVATHYAPKWLDGGKVEIVDIDDVFQTNKDANLHMKTLEVIRRFDVGRFCWMSDDIAFLKPIALSDIPILRSDTGLDGFKAGGAWMDRLRNTFYFALLHGSEAVYSYDVHAPQVFDGARLLDAMDGVDYETSPGLTIFTAWRAVCGEIGTEGEQPVSLWKETLRDAGEARDAKLDKTFVGYNDAAFSSFAFQRRMFSMFPDKSSFERYL